MKQTVFLIGAIIVAAIIIYFYYYNIAYTVFSPLPKTAKITTVVINTAIIPVEIAQGMRAVQKGLSGRTALDADKGMLFIFSSAARYGFWMPNMRFPIDIIWMNNGKVVDISHDVSNDFNLLKPRLYRPTEPAQYVLEVNAGFARKKRIKIGDAVSFH